MCLAKFLKELKNNVSTNIQNGRGEKSKEVTQGIGDFGGEVKIKV